MEMQIKDPSRQPMQCYANYFKIKANLPIITYRIIFDKEIPAESGKNFLNKILYNIKAEMLKKLKTYQIQGVIIYSPTNVEEPLVFTTEFDKETYKITIENSGLLDIIDSEHQYLNFIGRIFRSSQKMLRLKEISRKHFNSDNAKVFKDLQLEVWPGYSTSVGAFNHNVLVNIDVSFKVLRQETVFDYIRNLHNKMNSDELNDEIKGMTVMTL